ncbi:hypothetical protein B0H67DRAFT_383996 [Lasiosphaeris hirsuta]|uniref:C2H2-type domain-containing protein n=1 Tax=Lasiosphaeris hirsuta TaxID=260670 RepID=A0AA40DJ19_9PEZI|nr:hypothetical protein B0H67DRAFT_383996 [Lasiosphaeris hirsuta]
MTRLGVKTENPAGNGEIATRRVEESPWTEKEPSPTPTNDGERVSSGLDDPESDESGDEDDTDMFTDPPRPYPLLDPRHKFAPFKDSLVDVAYAAFSPVLQHKISSQRRWNDKKPPSPPATRYGSTADLGAPLGAEKGDLGETDADADGFVTEQIPTAAKPGLACPYFAHDSTRHKDCLQHDLRRIIDVKRHLWAAHRRPYYCPICSTIFDTAKVCDSHIRGRQCQRRPSLKPEGLSKDQLDQLDQLNQLTQSPDPWQSEKRDWFLIWDVVFPDQERPSPYLSNTIESVQAVGWLREYWERHGQCIIEDVLNKRGIYDGESRQEERNLAALQGLVLEDMIGRLLVGTR